MQTMSLPRVQSCLRSFCHDAFRIESGGYSFSSDLVPSLGATINQSIKLRKFIVSPYDPRYRYEWYTQCCQHLMFKRWNSHQPHYFLLFFVFLSGPGRYTSSSLLYTPLGSAHSNLHSSDTCRVQSSLWITLSTDSLLLISSSPSLLLILTVSPICWLMNPRESLPGEQITSLPRWFQ